MANKTLVGGFSFDDDWWRFLAMLAALGILPKSVRPAIGTVASAVLVHKILKRLGWL
jgi:hypothetical protein